MTYFVSTGMQNVSH